MVSYKKLWKMLIDKNITKTQLRTAIGFSSSTLAILNKNKNVSLNIIVKMCNYLKCDIGDIMEVINE